MIIIGNQETIVRIIALIIFVPLFVGFIGLCFYIKDKKEKQEGIPDSEKESRKKLK